MGRDYWRPLFDLMRDTMVKEGTIEAADVDRLTLTDSPDEAMAVLEHYAREHAGLALKPKQLAILGERGLPESAPGPK